MFQPNDQIIYGASGVCRVEAVGPLEGVSAADSSRLYYTLRPLFDNGIIRVPVDAKVFMRPVLTKDQADSMIEQIPTLPLDDGCAGTSPQLLSEHYRACFASHRCEDLLTLIKTLYAKTRRASARGKNLGRTDQHYFQRARDLVEQEFSVALGIPVEQVSDYIARKVAQAGSGEAAQLQ